MSLIVPIITAGSTHSREQFAVVHLQPLRVADLGAVFERKRVAPESKRCQLNTVCDM
jgi:hypothetical protein